VIQPVTTPPLVAVTFNSGPEVPADILLRLRALSPQLGLRFYQGKGWAVMWKWSENDRRRAYIQRGELPADEDNDIVAWLPEGVDADQAVAFVEARTAKHPNAHIRDLADTIRLERELQTEENFQPVMDEALNQIELRPDNLFASLGKTITKVRQAGFGKGTRTEANGTPNA
jgi:hypothetical protein